MPRPLEEPQMAGEPDHSASVRSRPCVTLNRRSTDVKQKVTLAGIASPAPPPRQNHTYSVAAIGKRQKNTFSKRFLVCCRKQIA